MLLKGEVSESVSGDQLNLVGNKVVSDYVLSSRNPFVRTYLKLPYYKRNAQGQFDGSVESMSSDYTNDWICGFMTSGFGWSLSSEYDDMLRQTGAQQTMSKILQGGSAVIQALPSGMKSFIDRFANIDMLESGTNKAMLSLQQTLSVWMGMKKPSFSIELLFFDGTGADKYAGSTNGNSGSLNVTQIGYLSELAQMPYVVPAGQNSDFSLFMQAPGGYKPMCKNVNQEGAGAEGRRYNVSAENTAELVICGYIKFMDLICTGVNIQYSDVLLNSGSPQYARIRYDFMMCRQPVLEDLNWRYPNLMAYHQIGNTSTDDDGNNVVWL